jgi:hypothetical protein
MICVYRIATGEAVSFATTVNSLPEDMSSVDVGDTEGKVWDPSTLTMILAPLAPSDPRAVAIASAMTLADLKEVV